ncbi:MAG TPA: carbon-nitrogen hydrolase family protein [Actinomycetota bacterium]|nr:carbon-nitrogen hydrolase family protein [Actinomycetota bacterium]
MRAAICQLNAGDDDVESNVVTAERLIGEAADSGADLAVLPELFAYYGSQRRMRQLAEPVGGPITSRLAALARARSMWVLGGSVCESADGRVYNTSLLFDRAGDVVARYRKIHLYDAELPGQRPIRESSLFSAGDEVVTHDVEGFRLGMSICYDLRFPELYRGLMTSGAVVLAVPSAFQAVTGAAHWEALLRARAIEEQSYVLAAAQWGPWGPPDAGHRTFGNAMIVDPWGSIVVRAPDEADGVWFAELDAGEVRAVRTRLPALSHRRLGNAC